MDTVVSLKMDMKEFPHCSEQTTQKAVKFSMSKGKFLQFSKDMKEALNLMEEMAW